MTVREFAEKLNLTYGWVSQIENGQISLKLDQYKQIQAALGYNFDTPEAEAAFAFFLSGAPDA
jgi:transcriptional regulator with XRE-family HTH domain